VQQRQKPTSRKPGKIVDELIFKVKGSSSDPYEITFIKDGSSLTAICTCPAGTFGNLCKHRVAIIDGDTKSIVSDNVDQVPKIAEWLRGTDVEIALTELRAAEIIKDFPKDEIKVLKRNLARAMNT